MDEKTHGNVRRTKCRADFVVWKLTSDGPAFVPFNLKSLVGGSEHETVERSYWEDPGVAAWSHCRDFETPNSLATVALMFTEGWDEVER